MPLIFRSLVPGVLLPVSLLPGSLYPLQLLAPLILPKVTVLLQSKLLQAHQFCNLNIFANIGASDAKKHQPYNRKVVLNALRSFCCYSCR